jgi:bifunctional non-homologous end joining protein LigD
MSLYRPRPRQPSGAPDLCLPTAAKAPPSGPDWIHEIKHDGFRILARRAGSKVLLISRKGHDLTYRFPLVASAMAQLPVQSCLIDGEAYPMRRQWPCGFPVASQSPVSRKAI